MRHRLNLWQHAAPQGQLRQGGRALRALSQHEVKAHRKFDAGQLWLRATTAKAKAPDGAFERRRLLS